MCLPLSGVLLKCWNMSKYVLGLVHDRSPDCSTGAKVDIFCPLPLMAVFSWTWKSSCSTKHLSPKCIKTADSTTITHSAHPKRFPLDEGAPQTKSPRAKPLQTLLAPFLLPWWQRNGCLSCQAGDGAQRKSLWALYRYLVQRRWLLMS